MLKDVHPAQVAGFFYPAEAQSLRALIATRCGKGARPDGGVAPKVVVAPHAGIVYSGSVAATAFGPWARRADPPRRIVIVGPAHRVAFRGLAIHPAMAWMTPLGEAKVARDLHPRLAEARAAAVDARPFAGEHSLEMHLVMLQAMLPAPFEILPILVGDAEPRRVAEALRLVWGGPETVIAVSSDLSHFLDRDERRGDRLRHRAADRSSRRGLARRPAGLRLSADHGGADDRRRTGPEGQRPASGDLGRRRGGRRRASSATAPSPSNTPPRPGSSEADRGAPALDRDGGSRRGGAARADGMPSLCARRPPVAGAVVAARDLRHAHRRAESCAAASARRRRAGR